MFGPKIIPMIAKEGEIHMDVDTVFDLFVCEMIFKHWNGYCKKSR